MLSDGRAMAFDIYTWQRNVFTEYIRLIPSFFHVDFVGEEGASVL
jgi:hypothetical protein